MSSRRLVPTLQVVSLASSMGYGVMFTVLDDFRDKYGIPESSLGLLVALGFFTSFAAQILIAPMADKGHARRLVVLGAWIEAIGTLGMAFGTNFSVLALSRFLMGVGAGAALPAVRRIVVQSDRENMGRNLGRILSFDVAGFATGPVLSAILADTIGFGAPFIIVAATLFILGFLVMSLDVPETAEELRTDKRLAFDLLRVKPLTGAILIGVALFLMIGTFDATFVVMMDDLGASNWMSNVGITAFALPLVFLGPVGGRLTQHVGPFVAAATGILFGAIFMVSYGVLTVPIIILTIGLFHGIVDGLTVTGSGMAVSMVAPPERLAGAQGLMGGLQTLIGGVAAALAGLNYEHLGRTVTFVVAAALMVSLVVAGLLFAGASVRSTSPRLRKEVPVA